MKRKRWRVIYVAVAGSIAAHLLLGPLVHVKFVDAAPEQPSRPFRIRYVAPPTPVPTKPPARVRQMQPKPLRHEPTTAPHLTPHTNQTPHGSPLAAHDGVKNSGAGRSGGGVLAQDAGTAVPSTPPVASPTPKPSCSAPYTEARTIEKYSPQVPQIAIDEGLNGHAQVKVDLSADGKVVDASIFQSTGNTLLDRAAVEAAERTTYGPKVVDCASVPGSYLFRVDFENQ
ncbi:MAG: hypothetical protein NVS9B12_07150 [Vulcanimicrobiaceae bacterium]